MYHSRIVHTDSASGYVLVVDVLIDIICSYMVCSILVGAVVYNPLPIYYIHPCMYTYYYIDYTSNIVVVTCN